MTIAAKKMKTIDAIETKNAVSSSEGEESGQPAHINHSASAASSLSLRDIVLKLKERIPDIENLKAATLNELRHNAPLMQSLVEDMVAKAITETIYEVRGSEAWKLKYRPCNRTLDALEASADIREKSLLKSWPMPDGRFLGEWTGGEIAELADDHGAKAEGFRRNMQFCKAIAAKVPSHKRIGEVLSDRVVMQIKLDVYGEDEPKL